MYFFTNYITITQHEIDIMSVIIWMYKFYFQTFQRNVSINQNANIILNILLPRKL